MRNFLILASALLIATPVFSAQWNVDPLTSRLMFEGEQAGEKFSGSFPKFTSVIEFDEATPEKGSIHITIDMAKAQIEGKDRLDSLPTEDWFAVKQFPTAEFTSTSIRSMDSAKAGVNHYVANGKLTIRGVSRDVSLPFSLKTVAKSTTARGELILSRKDFGIGQGRWSTEEWVKYMVKVTFELHASSQ